MSENSSYFLKKSLIAVKYIYFYVTQLERRRRKAAAAAAAVVRSSGSTCARLAETSCGGFQYCNCTCISY
jgi:hypothetical protein